MPGDEKVRESVEPAEDVQDVEHVEPPAGAVRDAVVLDGEPAPQPPGRFGEPGRPLNRSPLVVGLTGGLGLLLAYSAYLAVRNVLSILILIFIALFLAIGLNPAVAWLRRRGLPRGGAVAPSAWAPCWCCAAGCWPWCHR